MLQVLLEAAVTNEDKRYIKKLNSISVPPDVFGVAAKAVNAMTDSTRSHLEDRVVSVSQALERSGIDPLCKDHPISVIMFRVTALSHVFHQMSEQEFAALNEGGEAMDERVIAAAVSEPLIGVVLDGSRQLTFDLNSFRKALMHDGGLAA